MKEVGNLPVIFDWDAENVNRHFFGEVETTRPGKHTKNHGKSPCFMGKFTIFMDHVQ